MLMICIEIAFIFFILMDFWVLLSVVL